MKNGKVEHIAKAIGLLVLQGYTEEQAKNATQAVDDILLGLKTSDLAMEHGTEVFNKAYEFTEHIALEILRNMVPKA